MKGSFLQMFFLFLSLGISVIFVDGYENDSRPIATELTAGEAESDISLITQHRNQANETKTKNLSSITDILKPFGEKIKDKIVPKIKDKIVPKITKIFKSSTKNISSLMIPMSHYDYWFKGKGEDSLMDLPYSQLTHIYKYNLEGDELLESLILECLDEWQKHTCITFKEGEVKDLQKAIVFNLKSKDCGVSQDDKNYVFTLTSSCSDKNDIMMMLGLLFGLLLENLRPDRDSHIDIIDQNLGIKPMLWGKWDSKFLSTYDVPYDYTSVMHLRGQEFSRNGSITMATKDIMHQGLLSRYHNHLSHRDKKRANTYRGCLANWLIKCDIQDDPCQNEGYTGKNCKCVCRPGTAGNHCQDVIHEDYYGSILPECSSIIKEDTTIEAPLTNIDEEKGTWCSYKMIAPKGELVKLKFISFKLVKDDDRCYSSFLEIREKTETHGRYYCGSDIKPNQEFKSTKNELHLYLNVMAIDNSQNMKVEVKITSSNKGESNNAQNYLLILEAIFIIFFFRS